MLVSLNISVGDEDQSHDQLLNSSKAIGGEMAAETLPVSKPTNVAYETQCESVHSLTNSFTIRCIYKHYLIIHTCLCVCNIILLFFVLPALIFHRLPKRRVLFALLSADTIAYYPSSLFTASW